MKQVTHIFDKKLLCALSVVALFATHGAFAANNGCENEGNDRINPEIALCTTHVYNIGGIRNPDSGTDKQLMRDVIALKTTVMTQQMYKQYEYLDTMIRRFKTQLEKAVLTTKLMAANGGNSSSGTSGSSSSSSSGPSVSGDRYSNTVVDGARDCDTAGLPNEVFQCVLDNISSALSALDGGKTSEAKRQLQKDFEIAVRYGRGQYNKENLTTAKLQSCRNIGSSAVAIRKCATDLRSAVVGALDDYEKEHRTTTPVTR